MKEPNSYVEMLTFVIILRVALTSLTNALHGQLGECHFQLYFIFLVIHHRSQDVS